MAKNRANQFATMLHNNTNKITLILIYAILEWILIILLLLNSVFSYFIVKFAQYFGLNPPCFSCAQIHENETFQYHLCEFHSNEVSQKGLFSLNHQNVLCENCSSPVSGFREEARNVVFSKVERIDVIQIDGENEVNLNCSSCGVDFEKKCVDESFCFVNSIDDQIEKKCLDDRIEDEYGEENRENESEKQSSEDEELETEEPEIEVIRELNSFEENLIQFDKGEDLNSHDLKFFIHYSGNQLFPFELLDSKTEEHGKSSKDHEILESKTELSRNNFEDEVLEFGDFQKAHVNLREIDYSVHEKTEENRHNSEDHEVFALKTEENRNNFEDGDHEFGDFQKAHVNPREIDYSVHEKTEENQNNSEDHEVFASKTEENRNNFEDEHHEFGDFQKGHVKSQEIDYSVHEKTEENGSNSEYHELLASKTEENRNNFGDGDHEFGDFQKAHVNPTEIDYSVHEKTEENRDNSKDHEVFALKTEENQNNFEDGDHKFGDFQKAHMNPREIDYSVHEKTEESNLIDFDNKEVEYEDLEERDSNTHSVHEEDNVSIGAEIPVLDSIDEIKHELHFAHSSSFNNLLSNLENDFEEANLGKNVDDFDDEKHPETPSSIHSLNPFHKKWLDREESFDGSVISETDGVTTEKLKEALKAERKAFKDLYSELEEERNASMVATNETMAMINRLQEEKSQMQMEALQYQRMMEEQMEYDQQALELLNELMMKKENELESYRKKVLDYEAKEKIRSSLPISSSHSEDEDELSMDMDLYHIPKDVNTLDRNRENLGLRTPVNSVLDLESLANFEEERMSILGELKSLEEKLFALSKEEDRHFANLGVIEDHYEEINNTGFNSQVTGSTTNEFDNNEKQPMGKRVLPLSDTISVLNEDGVTVRNGVMVKTVFHPIKIEDTAVTRFELEKKRIDMEEEVNQLYERLQALEADREFLKHCIGSTKKGDKGMEILQEILHHLQDLRNVNIRAKNYADNTFI